MGFDETNESLFTCFTKMNPISLKRTSVIVIYWLTIIDKKHIVLWFAEVLSRMIKLMYIFVVILLSYSFKTREHMYSAFPFWNLDELLHLLNANINRFDERSLFPTPRTMCLLEFIFSTSSLAPAIFFLLQCCGYLCLTTIWTIYQFYHDWYFYWWWVPGYH